MNSGCYLEISMVCKTEGIGAFTRWSPCSFFPPRFPRLPLGVMHCMILLRPPPIFNRKDPSSDVVVIHYLVFTFFIFERQRENPKQIEIALTASVLATLWAGPGWSWAAHDCPGLPGGWQRPRAWASPAASQVRAGSWGLEQSLGLYTDVGFRAVFPLHCGS